MANGEVSYTVKELIGMLEKSITDQMSKILRQLEDLDNKLDLKASQIGLDNLAQKVDENSKRIALLELSKAGHEAVSNWQRWFFGAVGFAALGLAAELIRLAIG